MKKLQSSSTGPAGLSVVEWTRQAGIAESTYYTIPKPRRPRFVKIGKRILIIESAAHWLQRMRKRGGLPSRGKVVLR